MVIYCICEEAEPVIYSVCHRVDIGKPSDRIQSQPLSSGSRGELPPRKRFETQIKRFLEEQSVVGPWCFRRPGFPAPPCSKHWAEEGGARPLARPVPRHYRHPGNQGRWHLALMWTTRYKKCGALHEPSHHFSCTVNNERAGESAVTIVDGMRWRERLRRVGIRLNGIRFQFHPLPFTALFIDQQSKVTMFVRDRPSFPRD